MKVNFEKALGLEHNIGGYVARIASPKGIKKEVDGRVSYGFHTEGTNIPDKDGYCDVTEGIYQIIDICKWNRDHHLQWNIYLLVVDKKGKTYPVAEYLDNPYTEWVKPARKIVKAYFDGEKLETVDLTPQPKIPPKKNKLTVNFMNPPVEEKPKKKKEAKPEKEQKPTKAEKPAKKVESPKKKKPSGRPQEREQLEYGYARLMTFTGMVIGVYKITRHNKKYIEVETQKGVVRFSKEDGKQVNAEKPRYANKIEWNLDK